MQQDLTVVIPLGNSNVNALKKRLETIRDSVIQKLREQSPSTHFARWVVVENPNPEYLVEPHLLFTSNFDTDTNDRDAALQMYLEEFVAAVGEVTEPIWNFCQDYQPNTVFNSAKFLPFLRKYSYQTRFFYRNFPDKSVKVIQVSQTIRKAVDQVFSDDFEVNLDLISEQQISRLQAYVKEHHPECLNLRLEDFRPNLIAQNSIDQSRWWHGVLEFLVGVIRWIRSYNQRNKLSETETRALRKFYQQKRKEIAKTEDKIIQNLLKNQNELTIFVPLKRIRSYFRVILNITLSQVFRAHVAKLQGLTTIHFARWVILDKQEFHKRNYLLFESNYDGSWDSYIDDFIQFLTLGMNMIWGNCVEHPIGGCQDVHYFKEYIRKYQFPAQIFYCAYPDLNVKNIDANLRLSAAVLEMIKNNHTQHSVLASYLIGNKLRAVQTPKQLASALKSPKITVPKIRPSNPSRMAFLEWTSSKPHKERQDIQGIIVSGYGSLRFSNYLFLQIIDIEAARNWLKQTVSQITTAAQSKPSPAVNIAFTYAGIQKLKSIAREQFPSEFVEGMAEPNRSQQLGDVDVNNPTKWEDPWKRETESCTIAEDRIDILLLLQTETQLQLTELCNEHLYQFSEHEKQYGLKLITTETGYQDLLTLQQAKNANYNNPEDKGKEHFGYRDSISQPEIAGSPKLIKNRAEAIKAGEFILGYYNEDSNFPSSPLVPAAEDEYNNLKYIPRPFSIFGKQKDFGRNGSYLVFRKLEQDVNAFNDYFSKTFSNDPKQQALMKAKIVGRWQDGTPLVNAPESNSRQLLNQSDLNEFSYKDDVQGLRCPFGAHIRRMHPRDGLGTNPYTSLVVSRRRRIIRRGALYDNGDSKGLLFLCINADIRDQFEFIQQSWVNNPNFDSLSEERDPLIGNNPDGTNHLFTIPKEPLCQKLSLPNFVTVKGGAYFFLPSISALRFMANEDGKS